MSIIKTWQRLVRKDPITHLTREVQEIRRHLNALESEMDNWQCFVFPGEPDDTTNWQLTFTGAQCYWKSDDVAGDIATVYFSVPALPIVNSQSLMALATITSFIVFYHVENALNAGPKLTVYCRDPSGQSDDFTEVIGTESAAGATTVTTASAPHDISPAAINHSLNYLAYTTGFLAFKISEADQANNADLRILGALIAGTRSGHSELVKK